MATEGSIKERGTRLLSKVAEREKERGRDIDLVQDPRGFVVSMARAELVPREARFTCFGHRFVFSRGVQLCKRVSLEDDSLKKEENFMFQEAKSGLFTRETSNLSRV